MVSSHLHDFSFEEKQKLLRMVLDKVVVKDWRVDVHYNIPLPRPSHPTEQGVSTNFDLCCARRRTVQWLIKRPGREKGDRPA